MLKMLLIYFYCTVSKLGIDGLDELPKDWFTMSWKIKTLRVATTVFCQTGINQILQGLILFNVFINNLDDGIQNMLIKCSDNIKLGRVATFWRTGLEFKIILVNVERWSTTRIRFSRDEYKVAHSARTNQMYTYKIGNKGQILKDI